MAIYMPVEDIRTIARELNQDPPNNDGFFVDYDFNEHGYINIVRGSGSDLVYFYAYDATTLSVGSTKTVHNTTYYVAATEERQIGTANPFLKIALLTRYEPPDIPIVAGYGIPNLGAGRFIIDFGNIQLRENDAIEIERTFDGTNFHFLKRITSGPFIDNDLPPLANIGYRLRAIDNYKRISNWTNTIWLHSEFKRYELNPVAIKEAATWKSWGVFAPCVDFDDDLYHLFYTGATGANAGYQIGHGTLSISNWRQRLLSDTYWTHDSSPVIAPAGSGFMQNGTGESSLIRLAPYWIMAFTGYDNHNLGGMDAAGIGLSWSRSLNGPWTISSTTTPIIGLGSPGEWDDYDVFGCHLWYSTADNKYHALYSAGSDNTNQWQIGHAYSAGGSIADLFSVFTKDPANPVFTQGSSGEWDDYAVPHPRVYPWGSFLIHYFNGTDDNHVSGGIMQVGTAWSDLDLTTITRTRFNPDLGATDGLEGTIRIGHSLFLDPGTNDFFLFYGCGDVTPTTEARIHVAQLWR